MTSHALQSTLPDMSIYHTSDQPIHDSMKLGFVVSMMSMFDRYKDWSVSDIKNYLMAPIQLKQFHLFIHNHAPVGFVTWAYLPPDTAHMKMAGNRQMQPSDWRSGSELWGAEIVILPSYVRHCLEELKTVIPGDCKRVRARDMKTIRGRYGRIL